MTKDRTYSPKQVAATNDYLAQRATVHFRYDGKIRVIVIKAPDGRELYAGPSMQDADTVRKAHNASIQAHVTAI